MKSLLVLGIWFSLLPIAAKDWSPISVPGAWEDQVDGRHADLDGFAWYRCLVKVPLSWYGSRLLLTVVAIDNVDEAYFNGIKVGANGGMPPLYGNPSSDVRQPAVIDPDQVRFGDYNLVAYRVYDKEGQGGILKGPIQLARLHDALDLAGQWDFIPGDQKSYGQWPDNNADSPAARELVTTFLQRHGRGAAGQQGIVPADKESRERDMAMVRQRFEGNKNVHSNIAGKGDPLPPTTALAGLKARRGLTVDLVLSEPTITQPLYTEFDERGRLWVTEYIQYPKPAGLEVLTWDNHLRSVFDAVPPPPPYSKLEHKKYVGRDRISIHEDTTGDGVFDSHKIFLDGLNIVTSTCKGSGGVWVMNPPYLLFYPDADNNDIPDADPVVHLSGFGLQDTHSVANSLKWGPDGWLYAATGSTVTARIKVALKPEQSPIKFFGQTIWRYHPVSHEFELFAEGGWNTFGVDFDDQGRLYSGTNGGMQAVHFVPGAFYQKGFGKHGPHTNPYAFDYFYGIPIEGDKRRLVQQWLPYGGAAMPGLEGQFFGVNCLANRVAVLDTVPSGSSFNSHETASALESEDVWFRPVHAALAPDGGVYVSDFYDARITHVDPRDNWDRDHGRIYRIRAANATPIAPFDLNTKSSEALLPYLRHTNRWFRRTARRLLVDRQDVTIVQSLQSMLHEPDQIALEALWTLHGIKALDEASTRRALAHPNPNVRTWMIRLLGDSRQAVTDAEFQSILKLTEDVHPEIASQIASSIQRFPTAQALPMLAGLLKTERFTSDPFIPSQLWWALEKHVTANTAAVLTWLTEANLWHTPILETKLLSKLARRLAADPTNANLNHAATLLSSAPNESSRRQVIAGLERGLQGITLTSVPPRLDAAFGDTTHLDAASITLGMRLNSEAAVKTATRLASDPEHSSADRIKMVSRLAEKNRPEIAALFLKLAQGERKPSIQQAALNGLRRFSDPHIAKQLITLITSSDPGPARSTAISVLAGRKTWARALVKSVAAGQCTRESVPLDSLLIMQSHADDALTSQITGLWGNLRQPEAAKQQRMADITVLLDKQSGNAKNGALIFTQLCASCHTMFDNGAAIGPDLTGYERGNREFLLTAIVDPNLGVREEFELVTITLRPRDGESDNAVLSGFINELTDTSLKLVDLTGNQTVVATKDILNKQNSPASIMPEGLLDALSETQVRDLFAYLQATKAP